MSYLSGKNYLLPLKWHQTLRKTPYISRVTDAYIKAIRVYWRFSEANCHARFGTCADIVSFLCKFEPKWHQILNASLRYIDKLLTGKMLYNFVSISSKQARL